MTSRQERPGRHRAQRLSEPRAKPTEPADAVRQLREAVRRLAMDPDAAKAEYPAFVILADELVNDLGDLLECTEPGVLAMALSDEQRDRLTQLLASIDEAAMREGPSFWTMDALRHAGSWSRVRADASHILDSFG